MLEIDGSQKSGSGTILRLSIALAGISNKPLCVVPEPLHKHGEAVYLQKYLDQNSP